MHDAGHVKVMAEDEWAHIVLIAALSFTDDTALLRKSLVPELLVRAMHEASSRYHARALCRWTHTQACTFNLTQRLPVEFHTDVRSLLWGNPAMTMVHKQIS